MNCKVDDDINFSFIRYSNCWEDADILLKALRPCSGKLILSIASGGDNSLALASTGADVVAVDINHSQLACLELKCLAFRYLSLDDVLSFLGVLKTDSRLETYERMKKSLSAQAQAFWNRNKALIARGVIHSGKFENYFRLFREIIIPLIHTKKRVKQLLQEKDLEDRLEFYNKLWNNLRWRLSFRIFFSRFVMGRLGRDPAFFTHVKGAVADRILSRARYALTILPTHNNPYLEYILTGNFSKNLPFYLRPDQFKAVQKGIDNLKLFHGTVEEAARKFGRNGFDGFNLSNIFEYLDITTTNHIFSELLESANDKARLAYWNMLVPRSSPIELKGHLLHLTKLSHQLFKKDMAFFYNSFIVEEHQK